MRGLLLLLAASALTASPALAQHHHHQHHPAPAKKPVAKKPAAKKPAVKKATPKKAAVKKAAVKKVVAKKPVAKKASAKGLKPKAARPKAASESPARKQATVPEAADPHAGHEMAVQPTATDPHAGHTAPSAPDPHADHAAPKTSDPHAGHDMGATVAEPPLGPPPASAFTGPEHAADRVWGDRAMALSRRAAISEHGDMIAYKFLLDRAETRIGKGRNGYAVDAEAWVGGDRNKAWFKAELEGKRGERPEEAELQALWSRAVDPWFDAQVGIRGDLAGKNRAHLVVGLQGLAPYWVHVDAAAFLSTKGDLTARVEAEHDVRITQQLILQPRAEVTLAAQDVEAEGLGAGLSSLELGARLRYQVSPLFAPYLGLSLDQAFGGTRRFRRAEGERAGDLRLLVGIRSWF